MQDYTRTQWKIYIETLCAFFLVNSYVCLCPVDFFKNALNLAAVPADVNTSPSIH